MLFKPDDVYCNAIFKIFLFFLSFFFANGEVKVKNHSKTKTYFSCYHFCSCLICSTKTTEWDFILVYTSFCNTHCCVFLEICTIVTITEGTLTAVLGLCIFMVFENNWKQNSLSQTVETEWMLPHLEYNIVKYKFKISKWWQVRRIPLSVSSKPQHNFFR